MPVRLWNGEAYPRARLDRGAAFGVVSDDPFAEPPAFLPRVSHHPWLIATTAVAARQRSLAFGPFAGAALVKHFGYRATADNSVNTHCALRVTPTDTKDDVEEVRGTAIEGRLLTFGRQTGAVVATPYDQGYEFFTTNASAEKLQEELVIPVLDERFFLLITLVANGASSAMTGLLVVWSGIPAARLGEFL